MDQKKIAYLKIAVVLASFVLFLYSLLQIAFIVDYRQEPQPRYSLEALLFGWADIFSAGISWLGNFFLLLSWSVLFKKIKLALTASWFAAILALSFLYFDEVVSDDAGTRSEIIGYSPGYWLWLSSCLVSFMGTLVVYLLSKYTPVKER